MRVQQISELCPHCGFNIGGPSARIPGRKEAHDRYCADLAQHDDFEYLRGRLRDKQGVREIAKEIGHAKIHIGETITERVRGAEMVFSSWYYRHLTAHVSPRESRHEYIALMLGHPGKMVDLPKDLRQALEAKYGVNDSDPEWRSHG